MRLQFKLFLLTSVFLLSLTGCGIDGTSSSVVPRETTTVTETDNSVVGEKVDNTVKVNVTKSLLKEESDKQDLKVISKDYVVQDDKLKSLYPDLLQVEIENNSDKDIKNAIILFVAWDENNLPVKIKGDIDFSDGAYIKMVNFSDINLVPKGVYGKEKGFAISQECKISKFEAIPLSYTTFDGIEWENPLADVFTKMYEGVKYTDSLSVEYDEKVWLELTQNSGVVESKTVADEPKKDVNIDIADVESINAKLVEQDMYVKDTKYVVQSDDYKTLYPDMLQATLKNNTDKDVKDAVVGFMGWDSNGLPVKLKGNIDFSDGKYFVEVKYDGVNLVPNSVYDEDSGFALDNNIGVAEFKAIVVSYESYDGTTWTNPLLKDYKAIYEGKKLNK